MVKPGLPMTYILVIMERISLNMFKRHYLKNRNHFLEFLFHFCNLHKILRIWKKKISFIGYIFGRLLSPINVVT